MAPTNSPLRQSPIPTQPPAASPTAASPPAASPAVGSAADALLALDAQRLLREGQVDAGMRTALQCLDALAHEEAAAAGTSSAMRGLLATLRENPFLRTALARPHGYPGDPALVDSALELAALPPDTSELGFQMYRWMTEHARTFAGFRARRAHLAACIDDSAARAPGAPVVALFAGHARELKLSLAVHSRQARVHLLDYDVRALDEAQRDCQHDGEVRSQRVTLAGLLAGRCPIHDCGLIYAPSVAEHLPDDTLEALLGALLPSLREGGEIVVPAFTSLAEPGLLAVAADWHPNAWRVPRLLALGQFLEDCSVTVTEEPALGLAFLHLRRTRCRVPLEN